VALFKHTEKAAKSWAGKWYKFRTCSGRNWVEILKLKLFYNQLFFPDAHSQKRNTHTHKHTIAIKKRGKLNRKI